MSYTTSGDFIKTLQRARKNTTADKVLLTNCVWIYPDNGKLVVAAMNDRALMVWRCEVPADSDWQGDVAFIEARDVPNVCTIIKKCAGRSRMFSMSEMYKWLSGFVWNEPNLIKPYVDAYAPQEESI